MDRSKWEYKKLGDCFVSIGNGATIKQIKEAMGIPITRIETLSNDVFNRDRMGYANIDDATLYSSYILNDGDILMSHINSMKFLGRAVEYKKLDNEVIIHGMNLLRMVPTPDFLSSYAVYQFQTEFFRKQIKAISHQAVNQASFNVTNLKRLNVLVPTLADQQRIVAELDCLNEMIAVKQEQLKEFDKLAQSIFYDMFGDPVSNEKGWNIIKLGDICSCITKGTTPTTLGFSFVEKGVNFVKVESFVDGKIDISKITHITSECNLALSRSQLENEDLLICIAGATIGKMAVVDTSILPANTNQACAIVRLIDKNILHFIRSFLAIKLKNDIVQMGKGVAQPNLSLGQLRDFAISLPPLSLQQQFADKISAIEAQKELVKQSIAETQHLLDYTMDKYFG